MGDVGIFKGRLLRHRTQAHIEVFRRENLQVDVSERSKTEACALANAGMTDKAVWEECGVTLAKCTAKR